MKIGITYDLRDDYIAEGYTEEETAEFDHPRTIAAIEDTLQSLGYETDRIGHIRALARRLVAGNRWDLVFNIAEGLRGFGREAQVPALLDAWEIPYTFSDPLVLSLTLHKGLTKRVIRDRFGKERKGERHGLNLLRRLDDGEIRRRDSEVADHPLRHSLVQGE